MKYINIEQVKKDRAAMTDVETAEKAEQMMGSFIFQMMKLDGGKGCAEDYFKFADLVAQLGGFMLDEEALTAYRDQLRGAE